MIALEEIARRIDHTLLKPEASGAEVDCLCDEAFEYGFAGVCVSPVYVCRVADRISGASVASGGRCPAIVSVAGFPLGASVTEVKADEARRAMGDGATEIDMVIHVGALVAGDGAAVRRDIEALARVVHGANPAGLLKVIIETAVLTEAQSILACRLCAEGEADFVKSSTGLHPAGGATVEAVRLLHRHAAPMGVKAAGGIRTADVALAMIEAGATRIGTSSGVAIMEQARAAAR